MVDIREMHGWIFMFTTVFNRTVITPLLSLFFVLASLECCLNSVCSVTEGRVKSLEASSTVVLLVWSCACIPLIVKLDLLIVKLDFIHSAFGWAVILLP